MAKPSKTLSALFLCPDLKKLLLYFVKQPLVRIDVYKCVNAIEHNIAAVEKVLFYQGLQDFLVDRDRFVVVFLQIVMSGDKI
jgi:hypothetical protein